MLEDIVFRVQAQYTMNPKSMEPKSSTWASGLSPVSPKTTTNCTPDDKLIPYQASPVLTKVIQLLGIKCKAKWKVESINSTAKIFWHMHDDFHSASQFKYCGRSK